MGSKSVGAAPVFARYLGSEAERALFRDRVDAAYGQPMTHEFAAEARLALEDMAVLVSAPVGTAPGDWILVKSLEDVTIFRRNDGATGARQTTKGVGYIEGFTPAQMYAIVSAFGTRSMWDPIFDSGRLVRTLDANCNIGYGAVKGSWPVVQARDVSLLSATTVTAEGALINVARSIVTPEVPPLATKTRADVWMVGWQMDPVVRNGKPATKITYITRSDPKGWIPDAILAFVAEQTPSCVARVIQYARKFGAPPFPAFIGGRMVDSPDFSHETGEYSLPIRILVAPDVPPFTEFYIGKQRYPFGVDVSIVPPSAPVKLEAYESVFQDLQGFVVRIAPTSEAADGQVITVRMSPRTSGPATVRLNGSPAQPHLPPLSYPDVVYGKPKRTAEAVPAPSAAAHDVEVAPAPAPASAAPAPVAAAPAAVVAPLPAAPAAAPAARTLPAPVWNLTTDMLLADHDKRLLELLATSEQVFAQVAKESSTWEDLGSTDTYKLLRLPRGSHPTGILFGSIVIRGFTISEVMTTIRDDGCRRVWDRDLYDHTEFRRVLSARSVLIRACMKGKFPVSPRDVSIVAGWNRLSNGSILYVAGSQPDPAIPEDSNYVRAWSDYAAWLLEDVGTSDSPATRASYINLTNPSGWIPSSVMRLVMKEIPLAVRSIQQFLNTQGPPPIVERLAGTVVDLWSFDAPTSEFVLTFTSSPTPEHPTTLVHLPRKRYHGHGIVTVTPAATVAIRALSDSVLELEDVDPRATGKITIQIVHTRSGSGFVVNGALLTPATSVPAAAAAPAAAAPAKAAVPSTPAPATRPLAATGFAAAAEVADAASNSSAFLAPSAVERVSVGVPATPRRRLVPDENATERTQPPLPTPAAATATTSLSPGKSPVADALKTTARRVDQLENRLAAINRRLEFKLTDPDRAPFASRVRRSRPAWYTLLLFILAVLIFLARRRMLLRAA